MRLYRRVWYSSLATSLLFVLASAASAQNTTGRITGVVTDSGTNHPVSGVQVTVAGGRLGATSDAEGRYNINNVPAGTHVLDARRLDRKSVV